MAFISFYKNNEKNLFRNCFTAFCLIAVSFSTSCSTHHKITTADSASTVKTPVHWKAPASWHADNSDDYDTEKYQRNPTTVTSWTSPVRDGKAQRQRYVEKYKKAAIANRKKYGIPAAITLGQGILESGGGTSFLAINGNNHFGIKVGSNWHGKSLCKPNENIPYRKYESVADCFADHAKFLQRSRYSDLYKLDITDYKGWARTLKKCGYATDPSYADKLIRVIETYELYKLDQ